MPNDIANSDSVELRREHIIFGKNLGFKDKAVVNGYVKPRKSGRKASFL